MEAKKVGEELDRHQEQLLRYSFELGVKLAVLTNGLSWWFYLPLQSGSWEQRKFFAIDIERQEAAHVVEHFQRFLSKEAICVGQAVANAEKFQESKDRKRAIQAALPKAWGELLRQPDELLLELLTDAVERVLGHKPDAQTVADFLAEVARGAGPSAPPLRARGAREQGDQDQQRHQSASGSALQSGAEEADDQSFTNRPVRSFVFNGQSRNVKTYKELLLAVMQLVFVEHPAEFEHVLELRGRKRSYFSRDPNELFYPNQIGETGIYVETNLSANSIVQICQKVLALLGYGSGTLRIE